MAKQQLRKIFLTFFKIGLFTIGGGLAMIPIIQDEFVNKQKWLDDQDVTNVLALSQALPGVIAINSATFVGYKIAGVLGSSLATLGVVLPSFLIIFLLSLFYDSSITQNIFIHKAFIGFNAGITALIFLTTLKMFKGILGSAFSLFIAFATVFFVFVFNADISIVVLSSALLSYLYHYWRALREVQN